LQGKGPYSGKGERQVGGRNFSRSLKQRCTELNLLKTVLQGILKKRYELGGRFNFLRETGGKEDYVKREWAMNPRGGGAA